MLGFGPLFQSWKRERKPTDWRQDYPSTFRLGEDRLDGAPEIFDPALQHYARAFRKGEPFFASPQIAETWRAARRVAMTHIAEVVATSPWRDALILRGSLLLKAWIGAEAREPGDLDWVVTPQSRNAGDPETLKMLRGLVEAVVTRPCTGVQFHVDQVATDDIWLYDRAPGHRIVFGWSVPDLPPGTVQNDFVFNESLWEPAERLNVQTGDDLAWLWTASKAQSLAWKILWLESDCYPQGKDLYDAVLLAEQTHLPFELLKRAIDSSAEPPFRPELKPDLPMNWHVDWDNFVSEYPWVEGTLVEWQARLVRALKKTFAESTAAT